MGKKVKEEQEFCLHVGCTNEIAGSIEIGTLKLGSCKLHLDMVNGYVDLSGNEVIGLVTRPAIRIFENNEFELSPPPK